MEEKNCEAPTIYTNSIGVEASLYDVKFKISYLSSDEGKGTKRNLCEIVMSPQHAKTFSNVLNEMIKSYETQFGELKIKPDVKEGN